MREDPQPYALAVGKTTRYRPASAVVRMVLDDQTSESGVPGALSPAAPGGGMAAPGGGSSTVVGLGARAPTNSQSVGTRPGVGEIAVRLLSPTDIYLTGKRIGAANVVMVHAGGSCTLLNVVVGMDPSGLQAAIDQLLPEERERVPEGERVKVSAAFDSLVLRGTVSDSEALVRVTDLANAFLRGGETNGNSGAAAGMRCVQSTPSYSQVWFVPGLVNVALPPYMTNTPRLVSNTTSMSWATAAKSCVR